MILMMTMIMMTIIIIRRKMRTAYLRVKRSSCPWLRLSLTGESTGKLPEKGLCLMITLILVSVIMLIGVMRVFKTMTRMMFIKRMSRVVSLNLCTLNTEHTVCERGRRRWR